jgi:hypothetical protein
VEPAVQEDQVSLVWHTFELMSKKEYRFSFEEFSSAAELNAEDAALLKRAQEATADAYAPYSHFRVGAAARLANGAIVTGTNQENGSFPAGICAERTLLSAAASLFPGVGVEELAISISMRMARATVRSLPVAFAGSPYRR